MRRLFNFGPNNRAAIARVAEDGEWDKTYGWWLSGRLAGWYFSLTIRPWGRIVPGRLCYSPRPAGWPTRRGTR